MSAKYRLKQIEQSLKKRNAPYVTRMVEQDDRLWMVHEAPGVRLWLPVKDECRKPTDRDRPR